MKVQVTGAAGFSGSNLAMCLLERGDSVVGIDNQNAYYGPAIKEARLVRHANHPNYTHLRAEVVRELQNYGYEVLVHDPIAGSAEARHEYGTVLTPWEGLPQADALIAAVSHRQYQDRPLDDLQSKLQPTGVFVDVKSAYPPQAMTEMGLRVWRM